MPKRTIEKHEMSIASAIGGLMVMLVWAVMIVAWIAGMIRAMMPEQWRP